MIGADFMRKIISLSIVFAMIISCFCGSVLFKASAVELPMIGDINSDGKITMADAVASLRVTAGLDEKNIPYDEVYDTSGNNTTDTADALEILRYVLGMREKFGYAGVNPEYAPNDTAKSLGITSEIFDRALLSAGNYGRILQVMLKASKGEEINIAGLGGSITAGTGASSSTTCYAYHVYEWWRDTFPMAKVNFHNMGMGATTSMLGTHRLEADILNKNVDFLVIDFAVNDSGVEFGDPYESIIRRLSERDIACAMLFMLDQTGWNEQNVEIPIGEAYGIPMFSMHDAMWPEIESENIDWWDFGDDGIHPNDKGHAMTASVITSYLDALYDKMEYLSTVTKPIPQNYVYSDMFMNATLYHPADITPDSIGGWSLDPYSSFYHMKGHWYASKRCKDLTFTVTGREIGIFYRKVVDIQSAAGIQVTVDTNTPVVIDSHFKDGWGDCMETAIVYTSDKVEEHTVKIHWYGGATFNMFGLMVG